jgi:hypothetical protein
MHRRLIDADTGAAFGLIAGIILGSLALNLSGAADPTRPGADAGGQSPAAAGITTSGAATGAAADSQR